MRHRRAIDGLARILQQSRHERILIAGGPRSGKSTLTEKLGLDGYKVHDGEELKRLGVGLGPDGSLAASLWLDEPGPWICENVIMARALRKWLARNPRTGLPADLFIQLDTQVETRSPGQESMARGMCGAVWNGIEPELVRRGAKILRARNL